MRDRRPPPVLWSDEVGQADWITERLHPFGQDVGWLVPDTFPAAARVFHRIEPALDLTVERVTPGAKVHWRDVATWAGTEAGPLMRWETVRGAKANPPWGSDEPTVGTLPRADLGLLLQILERYTATPHRCWFAVGDGYGWVRGGEGVIAEAPGVVAAHVLAGPRVTVPQRGLLLWKGNLGGATAFMQDTVLQSPNLWWPDDRAWCVATDIDLRTTYVAGSKALVERLVVDPYLEVMVARFDDPT